MDLLIELERSLHSPQTRKNPMKLKQLLHPDFREVGASGMSYNIESIASMMNSETMTNDQIISQDFEIVPLATNIFLLLYNSCVLSPESAPRSFAKRSSIWIKNNQQWQIQYHQGTPCDAFVLHQE